MYTKYIDASQVIKTCFPPVHTEGVVLCCEFCVPGISLRVLVIDFTLISVVISPPYLEEIKSWSIKTVQFMSLP